VPPGRFKFHRTVGGQGPEAELVVVEAMVLVVVVVRIEAELVGSRRPTRCRRPGDVKDRGRAAAAHGSRG
jgi:hypothetical protein